MINDINQRSSHRAKAFNRAKRHSRLVGVLKFALPTIGLAVVGFFGFLTIKARMGSDVSLAGVALEGDRIVMQRPKLNGVTGNNSPYSVEAERALQAISDTNDIELEGITAQIPFGDNVTAQVLAPKGHLNNNTQILTLRGGFSLTSSDGMVALLEEAEIDFERGSLKTAMPVDIKRVGTHIKADSLVITESGAKLVFEKRVRMILQPDLIEQSKENSNDR